MMHLLWLLIIFSMGVVVGAVITLYLITPSAEEWEDYMSEEQDKFIQKITKQQ
jgi:hypothetical protein